MLLFSVLIISLISCVVAQSSVCNPMECFYHYYTLFERSAGDDPCFKIMRLENCVKLCSPSSQNMILDGLLSMKLECAENPSEFISTKCENKHKFSLLSCMFESSTLEPLNPVFNKSLIACRQASEGEKCDFQKLPQCYPRTMSYKLTETFFRPLHRKNCIYFSMQEPYDLKVKPSSFSSSIKGFQDLADCIDKSSYLIYECIPHKWVTPNFLISAHFGKRLCMATDAFLFCMQGVIRNKCKRLEPTFNVITQSLYNYTLPQCQVKTGSTISYKPFAPAHNYSEMSDAAAFESRDINETVNSNEESTATVNLTEASTSGPFNNSESEIVVIHQSVFVSLNFHDHVIHSAAGSISPFTNIFVLAILCIFHLQKQISK